MDSTTAVVRSLLKAPKANQYNVGVVGVTGAVGREMMKCMLKRQWQPKQIRVSICMKFYQMYV
jgi:hypothetical protein